MNFEKIISNGIIKTKDNYIKILKIIPINFNLKSQMEKESILKTFNSDIQIIIQSKKEDLTKHISNIEFQKNNEKNKIKKIADLYIEYIQNLNKNKKSSTKNYFIIIKNNKYNKELENYENIIFDDLNEKYLKIKDCLSRCGNTVIDINEKNEVNEILFSFVNINKFIFE